MAESPLLIFGADHKPVRNNIEQLRSALRSDQYRNLPVKVVSAAGVMRCGKSTTMNLFMRQLRAHEATRQSIDELGTSLKSDTELNGFPWGGGRESVPHGVYIWSRPFIVSDGNGDKSAVLLMDVEGAFDGATILRSAPIFVFAARVSSTVLFNVNRTIDESVIQLLDHFVATGNTPLQDVTIVVRDFTLGKTFGFPPGNELLEEMMEVTDPTDEAIQTARGRIRQFAPNLSCFLMPHPGLEAAEQNNWRDVRPKFLSCTSDLLCTAIRHSKLVEEQPLKCADFVANMESFFTVFDRDQQSSPRTLLDASQENTNLLALQEAEDGYRRDIRSLADRIGLEQAHEKLQRDAIEYLQHVQPPKVREQLTTELKERLERIRTIQEIMENIMAENEKLKTAISATATIGGTATAFEKASAIVPATAKATVAPAGMTTAIVNMIVGAAEVAAIVAMGMAVRATTVPAEVAAKATIGAALMAIITAALAARVTLEEVAEATIEVCERLWT